MSEIQILLSTFDDLTSAERIARKLVEERLAACANILPGISSVYYWQGELQLEREHVVILKTATDRLEDLMTRLQELHPYEIPEMVSWPLERSHLPYLEWVLKETRRA